MVAPSFSALQQVGHRCLLFALSRLLHLGKLRGPTLKTFGIDIEAFFHKLWKERHTALMPQASKFGEFGQHDLTAAANAICSSAEDVDVSVSVHAFARPIWLRLAAHTANPISVHVTEISPKKLQTPDSSPSTPLFLPRLEQGPLRDGAAVRVSHGPTAWYRANTALVILVARKAASLFGFPPGAICDGGTLVTARGILISSWRRWLDGIRRPCRQPFCLGSLHLGPILH